MIDETENIRTNMIETGQPQADLAEVQAHGGQQWSTDELTRDFDVLGFLAPFVAVKRKSDGKIGSLEFTHSPRVYFNFQEDRP